MKNFLIATIVLVVITPAISQQKPEVWSEARKAIEYVENEQFVVDSLRKTYYKKWILNFTYGQRFISSTNESIKPDTITFTDFTDKKSFFGVGGSYFWKDNWQIGVGVNFSIIPKKQEISSISFGNSGIEAEGQGSGGAIISLNLNTRYFLAEWKYVKPYLGLELSSIRLIAKGGEGTISGFNRTTSIRTRRSSFVSGQLLAGFTYRATPGFMIDWNIGYARTSDNEPIGGITSLSGVTTSLNLQFILNPKK